MEETHKANDVSKSSKKIPLSHLMGLLTATEMTVGDGGGQGNHQGV